MTALLPTLLTLLLFGASTLALAADRTRDGLIALYDFKDVDGVLIQDQSGVGEALDLKIADLKAVQRSPGALQVNGSVQIVSEKPARKLIDAVRQSGELTIEAWLQPAKLDQEGPARILSLSRDTSNRNFTFGQDGDAYELRLRSTKTSANGIPSVSAGSKSAVLKDTHVVYTRDRNGNARFYLNGQPGKAGKVQGDLGNWDKSYHLTLANERTNDRPWLGTYRLVAIYDRSLSADEVVHHFEAGASAELIADTAEARAKAAAAALQAKAAALQAKAAARQHESAALFETAVAPLIAKHCLECHDSATREGKLDLSREATTLAAGKKMKVLVPGKSAESKLWISVHEDEMPEDRPVLSKTEKEVLKTWIDSGAAWTREQIDPADYIQQEKASELYVQRLTVNEYIETVKSTVGVDIAKEARALLPPDARADGFSNTAYNLGVDLKHVHSYSQLASIIVSRMDVEAFAAQHTRVKKLMDKDARKFIDEVGTWVLRGPVTGPESDVYCGISTTVASAGGDFKEAVGYMLETMLQSPRFIYRIERQQGKPGSSWDVEPYELANRLSYIIWGAPPDKALMRAAEKNELSNEAAIQQQVSRMLQDPRALKRATQFAYEWLDLGRLDNLAPNPKAFPAWDAELAKDMRHESLAFFIQVAWKENRPLSDLLNAQFTYATPRLAKHYGLEPQGDGLKRYELVSIPSRGGLLTQGSVLTMGGDHASMVTRGLFLLHDVMRGVVRPPPPNLDLTPVASRKGLTQRGAAEIRIADAQCGGCHAKFEPLAFGLERFDGIGAYHERDTFGNALREDGEILFPGAEMAVKYQTASEMMDLLAASDRVAKTITWKVAQFALGRPLGGSDARLLDEVYRRAQEKGGTYAATLEALTTSELVRKTHAR
jgi:hypothetical protein